MNGPMIAMRNSWRGRLASPPICETPPKTNSVMLFTGMPEPQGNDAVRELMDQDGQEEDQPAGDGHHPVQGDVVAKLGARRDDGGVEADGEDGSDKREGEQPGEVDHHRDAQ